MDKDLLKILLTNLIDNAIKASRTGDVIFVRAYKNAAANVILQIQDQGVGISQEDLPKVFEPFFVADKSRAKEPLSY
ncbi:MULTISPECIES: ATP-binding protein [Brevibacillus]|uniref:ATP-binding protein n=1 Tax=Brevibacillus TaxID=55080 RepID=UPI000B9A2A93|nr:MULTISPECIES: ATP-binding protein [Brevibacillus]MCG7320150.1 ATP-binding protein [Brevibacillus laterosporus]RFB37766.1 ATP-binding protein [Brevibacillus sp. VP]